MRFALKVLRGASTLAISTFVLIALWVAYLWLFDIDDFVGKGPADVWDYLFAAPTAGENRSELFEALWVTLWDAGLGFVVGGAASVAIAVAFVVWKPVELTFMPVAMVLRSVPVVAMIPVLALVFGRDTVGVVVIVGIIVFFPTLVLVTHGLRSTAGEAIELLRVYDASTFEVLRKVRLPSAVPALFAAARIGTPGAILGALLCEWFLTGEGLGYLLLSAGTQTKYNLVWAATILISIVSIVLFTAVTTVERVALERYAPEAART
ncbi:MAG: ABC transporter permease subunit [Actinomycetota bacterium]|nr:ABC transporter permease subunit [Actinomycetota bacterium]